MREGDRERGTERMRKKRAGRGRRKEGVVRAQRDELNIKGKIREHSKRLISHCQSPTGKVPGGPRTAGVLGQEASRRQQPQGRPRTRAGDHQGGGDSGGRAQEQRRQRDEHQPGDPRARPRRRPEPAVPRAVRTRGQQQLLH